MELREYLGILRRRWWLPVGLVLLVGVLSAVQLRPWQPPTPNYTVSLRLLLGVMPLAEADSAAYDPRYYAWLTSEYLVDDFTEIVSSDLFARNASQRMGESAPQITAGMISGSAQTGQRHRIITLRFNWPDREQGLLMARAAADELVENASYYFLQLGTPGATATLLDGPSVTPVDPGVRRQLEFPLRILLALFVGVSLAFLLEYLDTSIRRPHELEELGLAVLGAVPKSRNRRLLRQRTASPSRSVES
jgi:capsular polysaccharide biosynthesis protein